MTENNELKDLLWERIHPRLHSALACFHASGSALKCFPQITPPFVGATSVAICSPGVFGIMQFSAYRLCLRCG